MNDAIPFAPDDPDPQFAAHLEWQVRTALRREKRFAEHARDGRPYWRALKLSAVFVVATALGAGGVLAAHEIHRSQAAQLLAGQYRVRLEIAQLREETARVSAAEVMRANERGFATPQQVSAAEEAQMAFALEASLLKLDVVEVAHSGKEPEHRISAAPVAGRDLVTERFEQELAAQRLRKSAAAKQFERTRALNAKGFASDGDVDEVRLLDQQLAGAIAAVERKLELRRRFVRGELSAERVDLLDLRADALARRDQAQREFESASVAAQRTAALAAAGFVSDREARSSVQDLAALEAQIRLTNLELDTLDARLAE